MKIMVAVLTAFFGTCISIGAWLVLDDYQANGIIYMLVGYFLSHVYYALYIYPLTICEHCK
jgi:hypothetical protein